MPPPVTLTTEGANQVISGTAIDNAGNTNTKSISVNIDKTPPSITQSQSPPANASGWTNTNVTITFNATDSLSGIGSITPPVILTTEGANQTISGTALEGKRGR